MNDMCEEEEYDEDDYEPDCMDIAKEHDIQMNSYACVVCNTDLHHTKEKGWFCPHGHPNPTLMTRGELKGTW